VREEHRLWVFDDRVLREILGTKREEVTGDGVKRHSEKLPDLYLSLNVNRWIIYGE
jgi:hypothetical protein